MDTARRVELIILSLILIAAAGVRLLGIRFGLPHVYYPDEALLVNHAMGFGTGDLNPHYFVYPSLYMYLLFVVYGLTYVGGFILGAFSSTHDFIRLFFTDSTLFYLPGRLIAAAAGVATVGVVYASGRQAYGERVGLVGAAFLAFSVLHVDFSHYVKTHIPAGLLVMSSLWLAWQISSGKGDWRRYVAAGAAGGAAASTVYHAALVCISIAVAYLVDTKHSSGRRRAEFGKLCAAGGAAVACFVIGTPFAVLDWQTFYSDLRSTGTLYYAGGFWEAGTFFPFTSLKDTIGQPLGVLALISLGYALVRRRPADLVFASLPLGLGMFLMLFATKERHHMLIAGAPLALLSASMLADAVDQLSVSRRTSGALLIVATILLVLGPARTSVLASHKLSLPDTRTAAREWVETHIPPGSRIVMDSGKYYLGLFGPPLPLSRWTLEQFIARGDSTAGGSIAVRDGTRRVAYSGESTFFREQLQVTSPGAPGYDIVQILHDVGSPRADVRSLEEYRALGAEYAIVSSYAWERYAVDADAARRAPEKASQYRSFYESLDVHTTLLRAFEPSADHVGPIVRVYKIN